MPRLACKVDLEPHMPLKLKGILMDYGIEQRAYAAAIVQTDGYVKGKPLSLTAAAKLLVKNEWPSLTPRKEIIRQTREFLFSQGVPADAIKFAFEFDPEDSHKFNHPKGTHTGQHGRSAQPQLMLEEAMLNPEHLGSSARQKFGLERNPFENDVQSAADVYMSRDQYEIREHMLSVAKYGGLVAIVGESGSGKSTLLNDMVDRINRDAEPIIVCTPSVLDVDLTSQVTRLTARRILEALLVQLSGEPPKLSLEKLTNQVKTALIAATSGESRNSVVLIVEEAHSMPPATLKVLKRLIELKDGLRNLLGAILIGQPEMHFLLNEVRHPELREFISRCYLATLMPLDNSVEDYLRLKFKRVKADFSAVFDATACDAIQRKLQAIDRKSGRTVSMVYPLHVNRLVVRALNKAAKVGEPRVTAEIIKEL